MLRCAENSILYDLVKWNIFYLTTLILSESHKFVDLINTANEYGTNLYEDNANSENTLHFRHVNPAIKRDYKSEHVIDRMEIKK